MSRIASRLRRGDDGFTLLEVIVSLGLFALMASAITPMLISALRASVVTKLDTGAKNLSQERFEVMRNMAYHLDVQVDSTPDLLDVHYPNLGAAPNTNSAGYVAPGGARRDGEPAAGAFYRVVYSPIPGFSQYTQYVATQFLDVNRSPVTPGATYNSQTVAFDQPPSMTVGVTVITVWDAGQLSKSFTVFSEIADGRPQKPRVTLEARAVAVRVVSLLDGQDLITEAGIVNLDGSLTTGSASGASARGASASIGDLRVDGSVRSAAAPPAVHPAGGTTSQQKLIYLERQVAEFGRSTVDEVGASTPSGEPAAGNASDPVTATLYDSHGFSVTNLPEVVDPGLMVLTDRPMVWSPAVVGTAVVAESTGWMRSTGGASHSVRTESGARSSVIKVMPTSFAPEGLVQVSLTSSSLACVTDGSNGSVTPQYQATLSYWRADPLVKGTGSYVSAGTLSHLNSADPLASALNLTAGAGGTVVYDDGVRPLYLGEYFKTLSSQTSASLLAGQSAEDGVEKMKASYAGMVSLSTVPLRTTDELSAIEVQLGALSCLVEDRR